MQARNNDAVEAFVKWPKNRESDNVPVSGPLLMTNFVLTKF